MAKNKSRLEKRVIRLSSSGEIFSREDTLYEEEVLLSLLSEASKKRLSLSTKVLITEEYLDPNMPESCQDPETYLEIRESEISVKDLQEFYKNLVGEDYSLEGEEARQEHETRFLEDKYCRYAGLYSWTCLAMACDQP